MLGYAACGPEVQFCCLPNPKHSQQRLITLGGALNIKSHLQRVFAVRCAIICGMILNKLAARLPGTPLPMFDSFNSQPTTRISLNGLSVTKRVKVSHEDFMKRECGYVQRLNRLYQATAGARELVSLVENTTVHYVGKDPDEEVKLKLTPQGAPPGYPQAL